MPRAHGTANKLPAYDLAVRAIAEGREDQVDPVLRKAILRYQEPLHGFPAFCREKLKIRTKAGRIVPFTLNRAQQRIWRRDFAPALASGDALWTYILKARQLGWSTLIAAVGYWRTSLWSDIHGFGATHETASVHKLLGMLKLFYRCAPEDFRPEQKISNRAELHFANPSDKGDLGLESHYGVAPATNENLGASQTLQFAHLSEFSLYDQRQLDVQAMLATFFETIADEPMTCVFLETTARQGYAKTMWNEDNAFRKIFISWIADEKYTMPTPAYRTPTGEPVAMTEATLESDPDSRWGDEVDARRKVIRELIDWYPEEAADSAWLKHESLCRLAWRRAKIQKLRRKGGVAFFQRENPLDADEAFATTASSVFDAQTLLADQRRARERHQRTAPKLFSYARLRQPERQRESWDIAAAEDWAGLLVFEDPRKGARYAIGADPGGGNEDGDASTLQILRLGDGLERGALFQAAVYRDKTIPHDLAALADALGREYNMGTIVPEANGLGKGLVDELAHRLLYPNLFARMIADARTEESTEKWGFATTHASKPLLIATLQDQIANGVLVLHDLATIGELLVYADQGNQRFGAPAGQHDDLVMALALALHGARYMPALQAPKPAKREWWKEPPTILGDPRSAPRGRQPQPAAMY